MDDDKQINTIILIGDSKIINFCKAALTDEPYHIIWAENFFVALPIIKENEPEVIIMSDRLEDIEFSAALKVIIVLNQLTNLILIVENDLPEEQLEKNDIVYSFLKYPFDIRELLLLINNTIGNLHLRYERDKLRSHLARIEHQHDRLKAIGVALSAEHDLDKLLDLILLECRNVTNSDAGSLYIKVGKERGRSEDGTMLDDEHLCFQIAQNDSVYVPFKGFVMPVSKENISGYVALTGNVLNIPDAYYMPGNTEFTFSTDFDKQINYRTKSMLVVPMRNKDEEIIGVLQLLNRKISSDAIVNPETADDVVLAYTKEDEKLISSLTSQAAVAIEKTQLYQEIEDLFSGFVQATVSSIESRDPTTSGHSRRMAELAIALAEHMNELDTGPFADVHFSAEELKQIYYSGLLHDVGKIGVPEAVLVKENKLLDSNMEVIKYRFYYIKQQQRIQFIQRKAELEKKGDENLAIQLKELENELAKQLNTLDNELILIQKVNFPSFLKDEDLMDLKTIAKKTFISEEGTEETYLSDYELENLSIRKGNLTNDEWKAIQSHVYHTTKMLTHIPWTRDLKRVPEIAGAHHEKMNGAGYPNGISGENIPLEGRILAVVDVFEALVAQDRPYKPAKPIPLAIKILCSMAEDNHLQKEIVDLFINDKIYEKYDELLKTI